MDSQRILSVMETQIDTMWRKCNMMSRKLTIFEKRENFIVFNNESARNMTNMIKQSLNSFGRLMVQWLTLL